MNLLRSDQFTNIKLLETNPGNIEIIPKFTTLFHAPPTWRNVTCNKKVHQMPLQTGNISGNGLTACLGRKDQSNKHPTLSPLPVPSCLVNWSALLSLSDSAQACDCPSLFGQLGTSFGCCRSLCCSKPPSNPLQVLPWAPSPMLFFLLFLSLSDQFWFSFSRSDISRIRIFFGWCFFCLLARSHHKMILARWPRSSVLWPCCRWGRTACPARQRDPGT